VVLFTAADALQSAFGKIQVLKVVEVLEGASRT
jgi:hypothetical protein